MNDTMLRIAICDDESAARDALRFELEKVIEEEKEQIIYEFSSGNNAVNWIKHHPGEIDVLFLDVEMEPLNGLEAAKAIREFDRELLLVFVTGYREYVFDGYLVNAMDYIIKPVDGPRLLVLLKRIRETINSNMSDVFIFQNTEGTYRIAKNKILYFYSEKRLVYLVTEEKKYPFYDKLDHIEETIGKEFIRIHQRYLINIPMVDFIGMNSIRVKGAELPISRAKKETAISLLAKKLLEGKCE